MDVRPRLKWRVRFLPIILLAALTLGSFSGSAWAAWPNDKVTDMLDDDIRALINLFADPKTGKTVKAIVVSTGNTQLKAEIAKKIVSAFGLNIPVYAGTSTDLATMGTGLRRKELFLQEWENFKPYLPGHPHHGAEGFSEHPFVVAVELECFFAFNRR